MPVLIRLSTGEAHLLDRNLGIDRVVELVNNGRGKGQLIEFQNNATPSRRIYIDPDVVVSITHNGFNY